MSASAEKSCAHLQQPVTQPAPKHSLPHVCAAQDTRGVWAGGSQPLARPSRITWTGSAAGTLQEGASDLYKILTFPQKLFESMSSKVLFPLLKKITFSKQLMHIHKHQSLDLVTASTPLPVTACLERKKIYILK